MALVAYSDNSDIGTDSEDGEETLDGKDKTADKWKASLDPSKSVFPVKQVGVDTIEDEDEDYIEDKVSSSGLFSSVPAAVPVTSLLAAGEEVEDELVDVPTVETWKVTQELKKQNNNGMRVSVLETQDTSTHKKDKKKVKIFIPSLSEFADDDDDDEVKEPPRKKVNPSKSGSGLFSVLPEPKHASAKEVGRSLVPHVLTKKPPQTQKLTRKVTKRPPAATGPVSNVSDDDEEEVPAGTSDFFSLSEGSDTNYARVAPELTPSHVPAAVAPSLEPIKEESRVPCTQPEGPSLPLEQHHQHYEEVGPSTMVQDPLQPAAVAADIDEAAILRLAGKRGRTDVINFIDVNADDALLTRQEWMTKALSEEKPQHGFSRKREGLPTQKQKQKHQITYLAHQAKERELDLKNTWAQNRMTKMQSQAKYGF